MAVSITPSLDLNQLLNQRPAVDRASSQTSSSNAVPQWNAAPPADSSNGTSPENLFSSALLDALVNSPISNDQAAVTSLANTAKPPEVSDTDAAEPPPATAAQNQTGKAAIAGPGLATGVPGKAQVNLLSLVLSAKKAEPPQTKETRAPNSKLSDRPQWPGSSYPLVNADTSFAAVPLKELSAPVPQPPAPDANGKTGATGLVASVNAKPAAPQPLAIANLSPVAAPADAPATSQNQNSESIVFQGRLISTQTSPAPAAAPVESQVKPVVQSLGPNAKNVPGNQTKVSLSGADQDAAPAPAVSATLGKGQAFQQETKQDGKPFDSSRTIAQTGPSGAVPSNAFAVQGGQNNPAGQDTSNSSSKAGGSPIVHQPVTDQATVKTDMNLKVQSQSGESITLRLSERAGDVQVTVRSTDPSTSAMLRHELPSIQAGLERAGFQLEGTSAQQHSSDSRSNSNNADQQASDQRSGSQEEQKRKNNQQNQWFDLMQ